MNIKKYIEYYRNIQGFTPIIVKLCVYCMINDNCYQLFTRIWFQKTLLVAYKGEGVYNLKIKF